MLGAVVFCLCFRQAHPTLKAIIPLELAMENICFLQKKRTNCSVQEEIKVFVFTKKGFIGKIASYLNCHTVEGSPGLTGLFSSGRVENQQ